MRPVYLDHNATTPLSPAALRAMDPYLKGQYGNPLTTHRFGESPAAAVQSARAEVLALFGADEESDAFQVVFNSGATESLNTAIKGVAFASMEDGRPGPRSRIVIGAMEHSAVSEPAAWLADRFGFEVVTVAPDRRGVVSEEDFLDKVDDSTVLAALHWANNEVGTVQPVGAIGAACRGRGVPFVCDAVQIVGKLDGSSASSFADLVAISAHKFYGPKGAGALLVRRGTALAPLVHGAQQEEGLRGGTHNVPGIVGLAAAAALARRRRGEDGVRLSLLRDALWDELYGRLDGAHWNGEGAELLPNTLNLSFDGCPSNALCDEMDQRGFAISAGAACLSGDPAPSKNLLAMGLSRTRALTSVRISLGHDTSAHDTSILADVMAEAVKKVRASV